MDTKWILTSLVFLFLALSAMIALVLPYLPVSPAISSSLAASANNRVETVLRKRASVAPGFTLSLFATGVDGARLMVETGRGDLLVSTRGSTIWHVAADRDGDGRSDRVRRLMTGLQEPHGLLLDEGWLYIAEEHQVTRIRYDDERGVVSGSRARVLVGLPDDGGHSTRTLKKGPDGWFYLAIGSSCNVCIERHPWRAAMLRFRPGAKPAKPEIFATGLRNTVGFDWRPETGMLYGVDNGRDWLGDDFPPDELNQIEKGRFYGWPYRNGDNVPDPDYGHRFKGTALPPAFGFKAHVAPLSIRFLRHQKSELNGTALIAQHGSWNRSKKQGYRVVSLRWPDEGNGRKKPVKGLFLEGFLARGRVLAKGRVWGRPVDILERRNGDILVSDDFGDAIWWLTKTR